MYVQLKAYFRWSNHVQLLHILNVDPLQERVIIEEGDN